MRPLFQLLLYVAAVILLGALLAPPLYHGGKWLAEVIVSFRQQDTPVIGWFGTKLTHADFGRYFNRAFLISALALLWPFLKWMGVSRNVIGLRRDSHALKDFAAGFLIAAGLLVAMAAGLVWLGAYRWNPEFDWMKVVPAAAGVAIVVALLEEFLFRGVILGLVLRTAPAWLAIIAVSFVFAILHLVKPPDPLPAALSGPPVWTSGFSMMAVIFRSYGDPALFISEVATLFVVGVILARARVATGSLILPIALHAGWVFAFKVVSAATRGTKSLRSGMWDWTVNDVRLPVIGTNLKTGLAPLGMLIVTGIIMAWWTRGRRDRGEG